MTFIRYMRFALAGTLILLASGCATIDITEQSFLRDKQQAILYSLVRHGDSTAAALAQRTQYDETSLNRALKRLEEEKLVTITDGKWQVSSLYREQEQEYVSAIEAFSLGKVQAALTTHTVSLFDVPNSVTKGAAFITPNATTSLFVFPGNGFTLVPGTVEVAKLIAPHRNVFVLEYPGMGESEGELTVSSLKRAAEDFTAYVRERDEVKDTAIVLYGFSLGGFVATHVSTTSPIDALILDATAPDMQGWVDSNVPLYAKALVDVNVDKNLADVSNITPIRHAEYPILFIAGDEDTITPPALVHELFDAAEKTRIKQFEILAGVDHGGSVDSPQFSTLVDAFLEKIGTK